LRGFYFCIESVSTALSSKYYYTDIVIKALIPIPELGLILIEGGIYYE